MGSFLEVEVRLYVSELRVATSWIDVLDHALAPCMCIIRRYAETIAQRNVQTHIPNICQAAVAAAGSAGVTEGVRLKRSAAAVPEVLRISQTQSMQLAPHNESMRQ